ncbi:aminoacyl-tRNA hydrolase [Kiloniella sp. b19]|uniref:aminoacyl-tRNA hydrolase n=1 Tax=Kiloniella sp. GXU_MW_B19 TaxID=3141326 RepID=UPI0031D99413
MLLFVGLGNPGPKYEKNRHNIGFMAVDELVRRLSFSPWKVRFSGRTSEGRIGSQKILILKPETYMNESGRSVREAAGFYKIPLEDIFVFHDDLDLAPGKLRVKQGGGHGGHNGLRSIDAHLGKDYWRVRQGIGHPGDKSRVHNYVLGDFAKAENKWLEAELDAITRHIGLLADHNSSAFGSKVAQDLAAVTGGNKPKAAENTGKQQDRPAQQQSASASAPGLTAKAKKSGQSSPETEPTRSTDNRSGLDALKDLFKR